MSAEEFSIEVDGLDASILRVVAIEGREAIDSPFRFVVRCEVHDDAPPRSAAGAVQALDVLTKKAKLTWPIGASGTRTIHGVVDEVEEARGHVTMVIVPRVAWLADTCDYRMFVDQTTVDIAKTVLSEHQIAVDDKVQRTLSKRAQCVQAWESDLAFVARILADEGIVWFPTREVEDSVTFVDTASTFEPIDGGDPHVSFVEEGGMRVDEAVFEASIRHRATTNKVILGDHDFTKPTVQLLGDAHAESDDLEWYEFPARFDASALGKTLAGIRLAELRRDRVVLHAKAHARRFTAGYVFDLEGAPAPMAAKWLVTEVRHRVAQPRTSAHDDQVAIAGGALEYLAELRGVPAGNGLRPARPKAPTLGGVENAVVTGASGKEIQLDAFGRIKTHLRWDRRSPADDTASNWTRVVQPQLSGAAFNPRVGWEVLLGFAGTSADAPFVIGRLYNGVARPPAGLPGKKVQSHWGTLSTPGGGGGHGITIDDTAGSESLAMTSSKDWNEQTEKDKVTTVAADLEKTVAATATEIIGVIKNVAVSALAKFDVSGSRSLTTPANCYITAAQENVMAGVRGVRVGGDYFSQGANLVRIVAAFKHVIPIQHESLFVDGGLFLTAVGGNLSLKTGMSETVGVGGLSGLKVSGTTTIKPVGGYGAGVMGWMTEKLGSLKESAGASVTFAFKNGKIHFKSGATMKGSDVVFKGTSKLQIKAGGVTIDMTSSSIKVTGGYYGMTPSVEKGTHKYG